jgi:hypothetical protein
MSKLYPELIQLDQPIPIHLTSRNESCIKSVDVYFVF